MQKGLQLEFRPTNRWVQRFSKRNLVHIARTLTPTLTALLFASAAHAQGTMDFTGATTLMTTFKNYSVHVFTREFSDIALKELDTISDFCAYLRRKEEALKGKQV